MNGIRRKNALKVAEAMRRFGVTTRAALALELGVTRQAVSQWGDTVPELMQYRIEERLRAEALAAMANAAPAKPRRAIRRSVDKRSLPA
jgi:predicted transcriptional regulator